MISLHSSISFVSAGLGAGDVERRLRGVHPEDLDPGRSEHASKRPGTAPHVEHRSRAQLVDQSHVVVEIGPVRVEHVVQNGEARVGEGAVGHGVTLGTAATRYGSVEVRPVLDLPGRPG